MSNLFINNRVPDADQYFPQNDPLIGTPLPSSVYPQNANTPILFQPLTLRGTTFKNRIFVSPMCQYSSDNGHATDWHLVHIGGFATRGAGAITMEATAVVPEGRISPEDAGLWTDSQIEPLKRIVNFVHSQGALIGIQLSHAGRKASTYAPWVRLGAAKSKRATQWCASEEENGWPNGVYAPSAIPFSEDYPKPNELTAEDILRLEDAYMAAVERCKKAGFDYIEVHAAHGYLLHEFLSPVSNHRTDQYGGSLENRFRFPLRIISRVRQAWDKPLFVRISASEWTEFPEKDESGDWKAWDIEQSQMFATELEKIGIDLLDVSSGGNYAKQNITLCHGYQVPFASLIKKTHPKLPISAVGLITSPKLAEQYLQEGLTDVVSLAREMLRNPQWALVAAQELGVAIKPANQFERAWMTVLAPRTGRPN